MKILWLLPDNQFIETDAPNIEQFLFILKFVDSVSLNDISYKIVHIELMVEKKPSISILLE